MAASVIADLNALEKNIKGSAKGLNSEVWGKLLK